ncbi:hypothetical protein [Rhodobacter sp. SY28-1]|uniref:hypothetical protein n=1 Tax=Rhodobacter sp. SY28-1 TaxID=2562317 RepID=UPI0010C10A37|nr:hypothetical protein [Rhodobacter sp. SY28-1]
MRVLAAILALSPAAAFAEAYHDYGSPEQCGAYEEAAYDRETWFPGGEGGQVSLTDPQPVRGLNAMLFEGTITEEGFSDPAGRVLTLRGPLQSATGTLADEVVVIMTDTGIRILQRCP